ncbi:Rossmann-like and DUF2520 domain-containing protein [Sphingopyxis sp.]|uniref:Rossmann-like and DUF2520 domain-containing protein n=1 Tax=Sphingopyxis sp. TaxID=1908224 RepID=UPI003D0F9933
MEDFHLGRFGVVGTGRVAQALALALAGRSAEPPCIWGRAPERARAVSARTGGEVAASLEELAAACDVIVLAVSDDAIASVVEDLTRLWPAGSNRFVFHVGGKSGAAILDPLRACGALTAAIHPAMTFTGDPEREIVRMAEARFAVTGASSDALTPAREVVARLGGIAVEVGEEQRTLYHAALCHASNHLVTLLAGALGALARAGVDDAAALVAPLVRVALENSLDRGFAALSGPVLRGDVQTVEDHVAALRVECPELLAAYRAMALATAEELDRRGAARNGGALRDALK